MTQPHLKIRLKHFAVSLLLITSLFATCLSFAAAQQPQDKPSTTPLPLPSLPDNIRKELEACDPQSMREVARLQEQAAQFNRDSMYASANAQFAQYEADSANHNANERLRDAQYYSNDNQTFWRKEAQKFPPGSPERTECDERIQNAINRAKENNDLAEKFKAKAKDKSREAGEKRVEAEKLRQQAEALSDKAHQIIVRVLNRCQKTAGTSVPKTPVNQFPGSPMTTPQGNPPNDQFDQGGNDVPDIQESEGKKEMKEGKKKDKEKKDAKKKDIDNEENTPEEPKMKKTSLKKSMIKNGLLIGGGIATGIILGKTGNHHPSDSREGAKEIQTQQTKCKKPKD